MNQEIASPEQETPSARKRLPDAEKAKALKLIEAGDSPKDVAAQFGVSVQSVLKWWKTRRSARPAQRKQAGKSRAAAKPRRALPAETAPLPEAARRSDAPNVDTLSRELAQLEKERYAIVEKERDVLKAILSLVEA